VMRCLLSLGVSLTCLTAGPGAAQQSLADAAQRARAAWLAHDATGLIGSSNSVVLQIPGADPSSPLGAAQATELLRRYLRSAEERGVEVRAVREVEEGRGLVELERRYVVVGTADVRRETLFLGLRRGERGWVLVELRSAP
ncbi:MAG: hypothetical protein ACREMR_03435, partial [Gemmatimonadales bacterium]